MSVCFHYDVICLRQFGNSSTIDKSGLKTTQTSLPTVLEIQKSKSRVVANVIPGEDPLSGSEVAIFSLSPHLEARELYGVSFKRGKISFMRAVPS